MELDIYSIVETSEIECKEASGGLPKDLWESYSAFANTNGGVIILGIKEKKGKFYPIGVDKHDNLIKDLWDNLNNPKKVSANLLSDSSINIKNFDGKTIIFINVPKADRKERPIYIGENPFNESKHLGSYRRNHTGDYKCSKEEVKRMIADQVDKSQDSIILEGFTLEDLNKDTIRSFKNRLAAKKPNHPWIALDDKSFLYKLGAYDKDRKTKIEGITVAGLLMFGEERSITDEFPKYFLDYREKISIDIRWDYRLISSDGTWSGNIFDFYFKVINRITDNLNVPFRLVNGVRQDDTRVHEAIREALANTLIHADYRLPRGIVIEKKKSEFRFENPGNLRITIEEALKGGISDPRNENIFKMFNLLGVGERAGSGLENIQLAWKEQEWLAPDLEELYDPDRIIFTLKTISMLPVASINFLKEKLGYEFNDLTKEQVITLVSIIHETSTSNNRLQQLLDVNSIESNKILISLVNKGLIVSDGVGRGTKYYLEDILKEAPLEACELDDEIDILSIDEKRILDFIINNGEITTKNCIDNLKLKKTKSIKIFNKLIKIGKVERVGSGSKIKYILTK